jgi:2-iminobutanoate/2-iminopropanoate deaminase
MPETTAAPGRVPAPRAAYSTAFAANGLLFTAGFGPHDPVTGTVIGQTIEEQTEVAIANVVGVLGFHGLTLADVVKATVHLHDVRRDFAGFETVYRRFFHPPFPVRTTVGSVLPDILVEIDVVAVEVDVAAVARRLSVHQDAK